MNLHANNPSKISDKITNNKQIKMENSSKLKMEQTKKSKFKEI
jgi:hypothetical protein